MRNTFARPSCASGGGQEEPHPEGYQEDQDRARYDGQLHGLVLHGLATDSIHFAIPPASSMTFLACA
jgi:hypothetical protein